nr:MAG TPA: hypothetical protein [Caudoviricetes sp.]DAO42217.1 MAG TPA: hypothetical protein [Caudoviricetes sp.]
MKQLFGFSERLLFSYHFCRGWRKTSRQQGRQPPYNKA